MVNGANSFQFGSIEGDVKIDNQHIDANGVIKKKSPSFVKKDPSSADKVEMSGKINAN